MSTPDIVAAGPGPQTGLDDHIYNRLLKERIIFLGSDVRDDNANAICAQMMLLAAEDPDRDIWLYINSPGGSVTAGMAIYDTMQFIQPDVATVAMGMAASMGQFLLSSGAKGKRFATPHARVMMHQPSGGIGGTASDIAIQAELILNMKRTLTQLTADQTGQTIHFSNETGGVLSGLGISNDGGTTLARALATMACGSMPRCSSSERTVTRYSSAVRPRADSMRNWWSSRAPS